MSALLSLSVLMRSVRGLLVVLAMTMAPLFALSQATPDADGVLGSDMRMSSGAGLVLVVSLQRAQ